VTITLTVGARTYSPMTSRFPAELGGRLANGDRVMTNGVEILRQDGPAFGIELRVAATPVILRVSPGPMMYSLETRKIQRQWAGAAARAFDGAPGPGT